MTTSSNTIEIRLTTPGSAEAVQALRVVRGALSELEGRGPAAMREVAQSVQGIRVEPIEGFESHMHDLSGSLDGAAVSAKNAEGALGQVAPPEAKRGVRELNRELERTEQRLERVGNSMRDFGGRWTMSITAPLFAVGGAAAYAHMEVEQAMAGVRKTTDLTSGELRQLKDDFAALSEQTGRPGQVELLGIAEAAGQLGVQKENLREFTEVIAAMRVSTNLLGEEGTQSMARFANIVQMPQTEFDRLGSSIVALGNNSSTTEREIMEMGLRIAGAGHQVGLTEAQILGIATGLSSVGVEAEAGGSAISRVMADIASAVAGGTKNLDEFARIAGMGRQEFVRLWQEDASEGLIRFIEGLARVKTEGQNVFGVLENVGFSQLRVRDSLLRAAGAGDLMRRSIRQGSEAWQENVALTKEADEFYNTLRGDLRAFRNEVFNTSEELGESLRPAFQDGLNVGRVFLDIVRGGVGIFAELPEGVRVTAFGITGLVAVVGPATYVLGSFVGVLGTIRRIAPETAKAIATVRGATGLAGLAALVSPTGILITGLGLIASGMLMIKVSAKEAAAEAKRALEEMRDAVRGMDVATAEARFSQVDRELQRVREADDRVNRAQARLDELLANPEHAYTAGVGADRMTFESDDVKRARLALTAARFDLDQATQHGTRTREIVVEEYRLLAEQLTDLRNAAEAAQASSPGGGAVGGVGSADLEALQSRATTLTSLYESLRYRGEDTSIVFQAILELNREIERSIRAQGEALSAQRAALLDVSSELAPIISPRLDLDELRGLQNVRLPSDFEIEERERLRLQRINGTGPARLLGADAREAGYAIGHSFVGYRINPKKDKSLETAGQEFDQAATIAISSLGAMAQAAITGTDQMERVVIQGFASIAQAAVAQTNPVLGTAIGVVGGLIGSLFGRRESQRPQPVRIEEYGSRALQQTKREGPDVVRVLVVSESGETLSETDYHRGRNQRRDVVARIPAKRRS